MSAIMAGILSRAGEEEYEVATLEELFEAYCKMDPISKEMNIDKIPLTQCDKWLQAAGILNGTDITTTDTGLCFFKFRKRAIDYDEFLQFLQDLAYTKKLDYEEVQRKLLTCSDPSSQDLQKES